MSGHTPGAPRGDSRSLPPRNDALTVLVLGDDALSVELLMTLRERGLEASAVPLSLALEAVRSMAPDLVATVCPNAEAEHAVLRRLAEDANSALLPVVVVAEEEPSKDASCFTHGVVAGIGRDRGADAIAQLILQTLTDLPERSGESRGLVEEATLDQLVGLLSRELRTGVLSVRGDAEAKIVLRAGKPLDQQVDSFMDRVRPMLRSERPVHYEFHEEASLRLDSVRPTAQAARPGATLLGRRLLVVHESAEVARRWTHALRDAGAHVVAVSDPYADLEAVRPLDPEVTLIEPDSLEGPMAGLLRRLRKDPQLRWTASLMASMPHAPAHAELPAEAVDAVARKIVELVAPLTGLEQRARRERSFETRLELAGPGPLLRALLASGRRLRMRVRHPEASVQVDLAPGLVSGASGMRRDHEREVLEGYDALALLLTLRSGRVHVEPIAGVALDNLHMELEIALAMAATRGAAPLPSVVPQRLVSQIPRAPRMPRFPGKARGPALELGRATAQLLLQPEQSASGKSRLGLLIAACVLGALAGLPSYLSPLELGNPVNRVQLGMGPGARGGTPRANPGALADAPEPDASAGARQAAAQRHVERALQLHGRGHLQEAENQYLLALLEQEDYPPALEGLVRVKLARKDAAAATDWALRLVAREPEQAGFHQLLGDVHRAAGRRRAARDAYARALELDAPEAARQLRASPQ